ncbi:Helix-turn-helix domain-containing protein, partial [Rhizobium sp. RU36D]
PLSNDLRERVVAAVLNGESSRAVAGRFGVAVSSVVKWSQRYRATGSVRSSKMGGYRKRILEPHRSFVIELLEQNSHLSLPGTGGRRKIASPAILHGACIIGKWDMGARRTVMRQLPGHPSASRKTLPDDLSQRSRLGEGEWLAPAPKGGRRRDTRRHIWPAVRRIMADAWPRRASRHWGKADLDCRWGLQSRRRRRPDPAIHPEARR